MTIESGFSNGSKLNKCLNNKNIIQDEIKLSLAKYIETKAKQTIISKINQKVKNF